ERLEKSVVAAAVHPQIEYDYLVGIALDRLEYSCEEIRKSLIVRVSDAIVLNIKKVVTGLLEPKTLVEMTEPERTLRWSAIDPTAVGPGQRLKGKAGQVGRSVRQAAKIVKIGGEG